MATEDTDIEAGGQTDDAGDTGDEEPTGDEGGERQQASEDQPKKPSHRERSANRYREAKERAANAERAAQEWQQRHGQLESEMRQLRSEIERDRQAAQSSNASTQKQEKIAALRRQAKTHLQMSAQYEVNKNAAAAEKEWAEWERLNDEANDLRAEMMDEKRWESRRGEIQRSIPDYQQAQALAGLDVVFPWVTKNEEARNMADVRLTYLINAGRPFNRETVMEAMTWTAKTLRLGGNTPPSDTSRRAYVGMGQRDGEGDGGSQGSMSVEDVKNNLAFRRLAQLAYPELEAEQAYAKWAKKEGSRAVAEARSSG